MHRLAAVFLLISFLAGCADPAAIQKFAQSAPPADGFHALLVDYANLPVQQQAVAGIISTGGQGTPADVAAAQAISDTRCGQIPALEKMHADLVGYMNALGALATAGTSSTSAASGKSPGASAQSSAAPLSGAGTQTSAAPSANTPGVVPGPCQPASGAGSRSPATAASAAASKAPAAGKTSSGTGTALAAVAGAAPAGGAPAANSSLSTALQKFAKTFKGGTVISQNEAGAAGSIIQLVADAATTLLREQALRDALAKNHDAFLAAIAVEQAVIQFGLLPAGSSDPGELAAYNSTLAQTLNRISALNGGRNQGYANVATSYLLLAIVNDNILTPSQTANIRKAAQDYRTALTKLAQAFNTLSDTSLSGGKILTPDMWTMINPLLTDAGNAYTALSKL